MTELEQLLEKLASRDLVIEQMRETLKKANHFHDFEDVIALQPSTEALAERDRKRDALLIRAVIDRIFDEGGTFYKWEKMRESGEWEPELEVK